MEANIYIYIKIPQVCSVLSDMFFKLYIFQIMTNHPTHNNKVKDYRDLVKDKYYLNILN